MSPISITYRSSSSDQSADSDKEGEIPLLQIPPLSTEINEKLEKARKAGKYLKLIVHCQRCNGNCNTLICKSTRLLLNHCAPCQQRDKCPIKGCFQTKKLLCHMIACRFERQSALKSGVEPKECLICSAAANSPCDQPQDTSSPDGQRPSLDMDGFMRPTMLPRRFRSSTHVGDITPPKGQLRHSLHNCRSYSVEEESEEMDTEEDEEDDNNFRRRYTSI
jgi:hypothetical protein